MGADAAEMLEQQRRLEELRFIEEEARRERLALEKFVAAQRPPIVAEEFPGEERGFTYKTWFKAFGTFGDARDMGDSPTLLGEMQELEDNSVPAAFYSTAKLGKARWDGARSAEEMIENLNQKVFEGLDFREIYPAWEYTHTIAKMVGDVVVKLYERKAKYPFDWTARREGYNPN